MRRGPLRSPLRSGPLLVRSLTYVTTGATEPLDYLSEDLLNFRQEARPRSPLRLRASPVPASREGRRTRRDLLPSVLGERDGAVEDDAELRPGLHVGLLLLLVDARAGAGRAAEDHADGRPLAAARNRPDDGARPRPPADEDGVALAVA